MTKFLSYIFTLSKLMINHYDFQIFEQLFFIFFNYIIISQNIC